MPKVLPKLLEEASPEERADREFVLKAGEDCYLHSWTCDISFQGPKMVQSFDVKNELEAAKPASVFDCLQGLRH